MVVGLLVDGHRGCHRKYPLGVIFAEALGIKDGAMATASTAAAAIIAANVNVVVVFIASSPIIKYKKLTGDLE